jgi:hypothetical protein
LLIFQTALVSGIALFTLSFLITSLKEHEPRAAMMAGALCVFLIGMELGIHVLYTLGFFFHFAGGLLGIPGAIDRPGELSNVAAMAAAFSIPPHFGKPQSHSPAVHATGDKRASVNAVEATLRVRNRVGPSYHIDFLSIDVKYSLVFRLRALFLDSKRPL